MELQINDPEIVTARELATHANEIKHLQDDMDKMVKEMAEIKEAIKIFFIIILHIYNYI